MNNFMRYFIAFSMGATLISFLDWYHCRIEVMSYIIKVDGWMIEQENWPLWIPIQMGIAGVMMVFLWKRIRRFLLKLAFSATEAKLISEKSPAINNFLVSGFFISVGYLLPFFFLGKWYRSSVYIVLEFISLLSVAICYNRMKVIAFIFCAICGTLFEYNLLNPENGYYYFVEKDIFGRAPLWLPFVYGWVGISIEALAKEDYQQEGTTIKDQQTK